jgi:hypothetical protein
MATLTLMVCEGSIHTAVVYHATRKRKREGKRAMKVS